MTDRRHPHTAMMKITIEGEGYRGIVVVDSIVNECSSGGVRIAAEVPEEEVRALAREMSLKYSFFQLPRGGAKAGISMPDEIASAERAAALRDFGRRLGRLVRSGVYSPGMDLNCGEQDLRDIYAGAGISVGRVTDSSFFTAISVREAIFAYRTVAAAGSDVLRVAIDGFGRVAAYLTEMLPEEQFSVVAFSTRVGGRTLAAGFSKQDLLRGRQEHGDAMVAKLTSGTAIRREEVLEADVDLLLPSSRTWVIHEGNAARVRARAIIPIANAPLTEPVIDTLHDRGIICLPGFVTNAGGVWGSSMLDHGVTLDKIEDLAREHYQPLVQQLLITSRRQGISPTRCAETIALDALSARLALPQPPGLTAKVVTRIRRRFEPRRRKAATALRTLQGSMSRVTRMLGE